MVLGASLHRDHLYKIGQAPAILSCASSQLLSTTTLSLIHHLTHEYYTTYANIFKLYLPNDIAKLIQKQPKSSTKSLKHQLIIMPDRRTIQHKQSEYNYTIDQAFGSQHTSIQDIKQFWNIKYGLTPMLVCTPGECFWDYRSLSQITLIDPHKRYYKSQQDPRYDIMRVCELMAHYYDAQFVIGH